MMGEKIALVAAGLGLGYSAMYFGMHRPGAPFQETGMVLQEDTTSTSTYVLLGVGALLAGAAISHFANQGQHG